MKEAGLAESQPVVEQVHKLIPRGGADVASVIMELHVDADADIYDEMASEMPSHEGDSSQARSTRTLRRSPAPADCTSSTRGPRPRRSATSRGPRSRLLPVGARMRSPHGS